MIWPKMMFGTLVLGATLALGQTQPATAPAAPKNTPQNNQHAGPRHGDWLRKYKDLPPDQQMKALENDPNFKKLPPERQEKLRQRLSQFNNLPPEQREKIVKRMRKFENLSPAQRQQARDLAQRYRQVPPERRQRMRQAMRDLAQMSPEDRNKALDSDQYRTDFSENEREIMRGMAEIRPHLKVGQND
jgi:DNA-directed RNA polymerase subunit F